MADSNSSTSMIVAIVAIVILALLGFFVFTQMGGDADTNVVPDVNVGENVDVVPDGQ